jgi:PAS domain S-box-containing protein
MLQGTGYDFKILFENKTVGIIIVDESGLILESNIYAGMLFGYTPCELRQLNVDDLVPKELKKSHTLHRHDYNQHPRTRVMGAGHELCGQRKDGTVFPLEISLSPFEKDGRHLIIAFIMDVTIRKQNEWRIRRQNEELEKIKVELQKLNAELEQKVGDRTKILQETLYELEASRNELAEALEKEKELSELKSRFVSMASHEFRTPLSAILSSAGLLERYIGTGQFDKCSRHIQKIKSGVEHLNAVLEDFLSLGKIEEGRIQVKMEDFNIGEKLNKIGAEMQELTKPGQHIVISGDTNLTIHSDESLLRNALINLLSNAIKFSEEGADIEINAVRQNGSLLIHVKDHGIGIPEEEHKYLFDRFFRASNASNIQGTGLGLYIVKRYVEMINGQLLFYSKPGEGTTFTIQLPV